MAEHRFQPLTFDEVSVGDTWQSHARTVTEGDIVNFACLTGDFDPLHVDHHYARSTPFGRPLAHGLLGMSLVAGLGSQSPPMLNSAFIRVAEWKFLQPLFIGDTVHVFTELKEKHPHGRRNGMCVWHRQLVNSGTGEVIQAGIFETMVKTTRPSEKPTKDESAS